MRTKSFILTFLMMMFCSVSFGQTSKWGIPDTHCESTMTMITKIVIDGAVQGSDVEIAAFCGGKLRGTARPDVQDDNIVYLVIHGNIPTAGDPAEVISFRFYDHAADRELFYPYPDIVFEDNKVIGSYSSVSNGNGLINLTSVAKIGDVKYGTLQAAINAAQNGDVVTLLTNVEENVTVVQASDVAFTIDGDGKTMSGTITVDGKSQAYATAGLTIKNVTFDATSVADACISLGVSGNNNTRYTSNVKVEDCTFSGTGQAKVGIKNYTGGCKNLVVTGCKATDLHSLIQVKGVVGITVDDVEITNCKNGIAVGTSTDVVVENSNIATTGYGVRADGEGAYKMTLAGNTIIADLPVVVRKTTSAYDLTVESGTYTASNEKGSAVTFTTGDDGTFEAPTADATATIADGVNVTTFGFEAKIGAIYHTTVANAATAATTTDGTQTIVLIQNAEATTNPLNVEIIDLNGKTIKADILGTVKTNGGLWVTPQDYKMIGKDADIYATNAATVITDANNITIEEGDVTLVPTEWWTAQGQELIIGENAIFTIPQGKKFNIEPNTSVTINGTVNNEGTLAIKNDATVKGNITGDIHFLGGKYITADNYNMVGTTSDYYYNTTNALVNIAGQFGDITIKSGEMTLGQSWRTVQGQTLTIASGAKFTVPATMTFEVFQNTHVVVNGTLVTDGTVYLQLNATVKAAEGLNVTTNVADHKVVYEDGVYKVVAKNYVAQTETGAKFETLKEAIDAANETVTLLDDAIGAGVVINKNITIDFNGKTYTVNQAVGSTGTESQGFQLLKNNTVTLKNGNIAIAENTNVKWMFNAYADVTLENLNVNCANMKDPAEDEANYVLVVNNGGGATPTVNYSNITIANLPTGATPIWLDPTTTFKAEEGLKDLIETEEGYVVAYEDGEYTAEKLRATFAGGAYAAYAANKPREHFSINLYDVYASQSLVVKVYHDETLLLTTTYRDYDLDDTQHTSPRYPVSTAPGKGLTVNNVVSGKVAGSWLNEYEFENEYSGNKHFAVDNVPNKFEVYVDGTLTDTYDGTENPNAGFSSAEHLKTYLGFDGVYKAASVTRGIDVTYYMTLAEAWNATQDGDIVTLYDNVTLASRLDVTNKITLNLNAKNITANFEDQYGAIYVKKGAELTIEGEGDITSNNSVAIGTYGTVNIKGGNITSGEGYAALYMFYYQNDYEGTANISGGSLNTVWNCGTLNVSGGQIDYLNTSSELNVTGGVITKMLAKDGSHASGAYEMNIQNIETTVPTVEVPEHFKFVEIRENVYKVVEKVYIAQTETGAKFETLQEAVNAAQANETVTLLQPATGAGVVINKDVTIDFATYTYTVNQAVGSAGTETLGFQILKDNTVTLMNGTLTSTTPVVSGKEIKMLIQNYADLTLTNMNLVDNTDHILYALSNNSGNVKLDGNTNITTDKVAFDVYDYTAGGYAHPVVNVNTTGTISGKIEVSESISNNLNISAGTFTKEIKEAWCAEGYIPTQNTDGTWTVKAGKYVARNTTTGQGYETLVEAVAAAAADQEVKLLSNVTLASSLNVNRNVVLELNGYNIESGTIKAIVISNAQLTVNDSENKGVISAPQATLYVAENAKLIVNGGTIEGASAIQGNGSLNGTEVTINGGKIDGKGEIAIYHPQNGVLNIKGGTIVGSAGVEMRAGTLNMTAGTVEATGTFATRKHDSGQTVDGVAIALSQHTTNHNVDINITGGTIKSSANGKAFYQDRLTETYTPSTNITADIAATVEGAVEAAELGYNIVENNGVYSLVYVGFEAQIGEVKYETLVEAVDAAQVGQTVNVLRDATGAGVVINKNITIDFGGFTYSFNEGVGSTGTESNGFQILQGNTVVLKNGGLNVNADDADEFYILVQNYANLTVENMTLDGTNLDKWSLTDGDSYVLSNNSGTVNITGATNITANNDGDKAFAFDVCKYANYAVPTVNVNTTGTIAGKIEVSSEIPTNLNISGGTFTVEVEEAWCADGFIPKDNGDGTWTVKEGEYVARNTTTGQGYESLRAAVETANAGETITLLQDITLEGGYVDATEGLRIELKGEDYADDKYLTIDGNGKTINCGNYEKGIRIYNENSKLRRLDINNVTIVNNNTKGRCIDTRSGMINLKINNSELTATNGNSQPLTIGGNDEIHRVMLGNTKINAGNSGYGVICFVSTNVDIQTAGNTQIDGYAAFYIKGDDKTVNLNLGQGVYTGKNVHSGESNNFGAVVLEGDNVSVNLYGTNPTVKAIAEGTAPQTAFLVLGENNTITIKSETTQVVTEGDNAYWAMIDADIASSTTIRYGKEIANNQYEYTPILPAAEARGFQFMSLEEAIRFANAGETVTIVNDNTMTATVVVEKNLTIDLNNKTVSYSSTAASPAIRVLADVTVKNGTIKTTNAEGNNYCFIVGQGEKAGKLTIESGLYDASLGGTSVASVTNGELNIEGGEFISKEYNGDHRYLINCLDANYNNGTATVAISGGTFHKFNPENNLAEGADTNFCPEGYIAVYDADNDTYTVKEGVWRAQIGDVKYETVSAAVKAAVDGNVIELLGDVTENFTVGYEATDIKKITIDLKQHTLSSSDLTITINRTGTELTLVNGTVTGNSTGGTIRPTGGGKLILGDDVIVKSGGQAKAIYLHNGHFIVEKDKNVEVYGGIGFLDADNNNNNNEPTVNYISIASGYYQGAIEINDESTCILTGGTYTQDVNEWCAQGYVSQNNGDGTWTVTPAQIITLEERWNWVSHYVVGNTNSDILTQLQNGLGAYGVQIKNQNDFTDYGTDSQGNTGWFGPLSTTSVKEMYKVNTSLASGETLPIQLAGTVVDPESHPIEMAVNWNYIGYPLSESVNVGTVFSGFAENGDYVKSQDAFAEYYNGTWHGNLKSMNPGEGYMYQRSTAGTFTYSYPSTREAVKANVTSENNYWVPASSQYADNMTMVAMLDVKGGDYEVAAFVGGEVRGSARPVYIESLDAYMFFLTIHGDEVEEMTFKVYDLATGEEYDLNNRMNYSNDAVVGSIGNPYLLSRGTTGIGESALTEVNIYPNPTTTGREVNLGSVCDTVEVFNALGVKVAEYQNVDAIDALETAGIYVIRITNNGNVQNCRLIVK